MIENILLILDIIIKIWALILILLWIVVFYNFLIILTMLKYLIKDFKENYELIKQIATSPIKILFNYFKK